MKKVILLLALLLNTNIFSEEYILKMIDSQSKSIKVLPFNTLEVEEAEKVYETCAEGKTVVADRVELLSMINSGQDVSDVCTSLVTNMNFLFRNNATFNQDISGWDVSSVTTMSEMFFVATSFNQDISGWDVNNVNDYINFSTFSGLSTANTPSKFR